jgi:FkbM family methyltransferase
MRFDHIDIGTSDFDVADGIFSNDKRYLLVEPLQEYLDRLPSGNHIFKECAACSNTEGFLEVHFIPPAAISALGLPDWVRGCNKVNARHPTVVKLLEERDIPIENIVARKVPIVRFDSLIKKYEISSAACIKVDTEGHDHIILEQIAQCILKGKFTCDQIKVEYMRGFSNTDAVDLAAYSLRKIFPNFIFDSENLTLCR